VRPSSRRDEDVFDRFDRNAEVQSATWFESCRKDDPLLATDGRFAHALRSRKANLHAMTTPGGHDWQSWNAALPDMFRIVEKALR
jgi:S-formylglutathione hydrolase FrmB